MAEAAKRRKISPGSRKYFEKYEGTPSRSYLAITIKGVNLTLVQRGHPFMKARENKGQFWLVDGSWYVYTGSLSRMDMYKVAGYDMNKIDFAVPQPWLDQPEILKRWRKERAVWSYAGKTGRIFGKPIWDGEAKKRFLRMVKARMRT